MVNRVSVCVWGGGGGGGGGCRFTMHIGLGSFHKNFNCFDQWFSKFFRMQFDVFTQNLELLLAL